MAMSTEEKTAYKRKYNEEKYARIGLYLGKEEKERWQLFADANNMSLNELIKKSVNMMINGGGLEDRFGSEPRSV